MFITPRLFLLSAVVLGLRAQTIVTDLKGGYALAAADVNHDGRMDLIAVASGQPDLVWYENPTWERHVLATGFAHLINAAAYDYDGDGIPEIAVAFEFSDQLAKSIGVVAILHHDGDPKNPWTVMEIDRLSTSHRLRWADLFGDGKRELVNAPLRGVALQGDTGDHVPLVFYRPGEWKRELISDQNAGVQHGIFVVDWDAAGRDDVLTASDSGIDLHRFRRGKWIRDEQSASPASDVAVIGTGERRVMASIEPWHGNTVAVYELERTRWVRQVIDTTLNDGHTILFVSPVKIVVGYRGNGGGVNEYTRVRGKWTKTVLDSKPTAACIAFGAGVACIGGAEIRLYALQ